MDINEAKAIIWASAGMSAVIGFLWYMDGYHPKIAKYLLSYGLSVAIFMVLWVFKVLIMGV